MQTGRKLQTLDIVKILLVGAMSRLSFVVRRFRVSFPSKAKIFSVLLCSDRLWTTTRLASN